MGSTVCPSHCHCLISVHHNPVIKWRENNFRKNSTLVLYHDVYMIKIMSELWIRNRSERYSTCIFVVVK